jgi:hypothetical protein
MRKSLSHSIFLFSPVIFLFLIFTHCSSDKYYASPEEVIQANIDYMNTENLDGVLSTIHPDSPSYKITEDIAKKLFQLYDLKYTLEKIEVTDDNGQQATVNFTQLTTKINGPEFRNDRIKGKHIVRKDGDSWKIYSTQVLDTEFLN